MLDRRHNRLRSLAALLLGLYFAPLAAAAEGHLLPSIFNGTNLEGWKAPNDNLWWSAADGVLAAKSDPAKQGAILWTEKSFRDFVLEFEFRFGPGTVDSGVFIRDDSQQIQLGISGSLNRDMTGSPYIPAEKGYPVEAMGVNDLLMPDGWNRMTIVAKGPHYLIWLNGRLVLNYRSATAVQEGPIGLQLHPDREMSIEFRDIRLAELD